MSRRNISAVVIMFCTQSLNPIAAVRIAILALALSSLKSYVTSVYHKIQVGLQGANHPQQLLLLVIIVCINAVALNTNAPQAQAKTNSMLSSQRRAIIRIVQPPRNHQHPLVCHPPERSLVNNKPSLIKFLSRWH